MQNTVISLQNVTIQNENKVVLTDINFEVLSGDFVFLIGKTGSGKTSLIKLILGLLRPETGVALIVGTDVRQLSRSALYRRVGTVFQEPWIFNGTLRENVNLGHDEFDDADVVRCLKLAGANFVGEEHSEDLDVLLHDR